MRRSKEEDQKDQHKLALVGALFFSLLLSGIWRENSVELACQQYNTRF